MKYVLAFSGGLDSTVLLHYLLHRGDRVACLSVDYGQRHGIELERAREIAALANVEHKVVDLSHVRDLMGGSSQTDPAVPVPHGHYEEESMKATVVPNRNMVLLSLCISWAVAMNVHRIAYAAHAGDHAIYPDCRPEFIDAMENAAMLCDWKPVMVYAPFARHDKAKIVSIGKRVGAPMHLTWTCYEGDRETLRHCGECGACVERREAFEAAGVEDPTPYRSER